MTRDGEALLRVAREAKLYQAKIDEAEAQRDILKEAVREARHQEGFHLREIERAAAMFSGVTVYNWTTEPPQPRTGKKSPVNTLRRMRHGGSK